MAVESRRWALEHPQQALHLALPVHPARVSTAQGSTEPEASRSLNEQLIEAAWDADVERVAALVAQGADVNYRDRRQESCHLIATSEGYLELLRFTLAHGADLGVYDSYGGNGMIRAAERGHAEACALLARAGDGIEHVNRLSYTALTEAVIFGDGSRRYLETVECLLACGADPSFRVQGESVLKAAELRGQDAVATAMARALAGEMLDREEATAYLLESAAEGDSAGLVLAIRALGWQDVAADTVSACRSELEGGRRHDYQACLTLLDWLYG